MQWACRFALFFFVSTGAALANWTSVKAGPFVVFSELGAKETRQRAAELEQFRFSLGELLGRHELPLHPPLQVFLFQKRPARFPVSAAPITTRTGALALIEGDGPFPPAVRETLARLLLEQNVSRMPEKLEHGLVEFLSTTQVQGARVTWGAPPRDRDADWATIDWLVTNPETYGKVRVLLANLENNVDEDVAYRNAIGKSPADVAREVAAFREGGHFPTIDAPSRALSVNRDLMVREVDPDDMKLYLADLLDSESTERYRSLMSDGKHRAEAEEGLALLAVRRNDIAGAADLLRDAMEDGSKNGRAMVEYAKIETDSRKSRDALRDAVEADPDNAEAHFLLGQRLPDEEQQIREFGLATKLAPRKQEYWIALAKVDAAMRRWPDAAKAWRGAEQAAPTAEEREKMMAARLAIEGKRLDFEDAEKRRTEAAKKEEIDGLKQKAIAEIRSAEAKVNRGGSAKDSGTATVDWDEINKPDGNSVVEGQITRVDCAGKQKQIVLQTADGKLVKLNADPAKVSAPECGVHDHMPASITYTTKTRARPGIAGDAVAITLR